MYSSSAYIFYRQQKIETLAACYEEVALVILKKLQYFVTSVFVQKSIAIFVIEAFINTFCVETTYP